MRGQGVQVDGEGAVGARAQLLGQQTSQSSVPVRLLCLLIGLLLLSVLLLLMTLLLLLLIAQRTGEQNLGQVGGEVGVIPPQFPLIVQLIRLDQRLVLLQRVAALLGEVLEAEQQTLLQLVRRPALLVGRHLRQERLGDLQKRMNFSMYVKYAGAIILT